MDIVAEHRKTYNFFYDITGVAMMVHGEYKPGLLETAYEAALEYLLSLKGYSVEHQVILPMYWKEIKLNRTYRMDLVVNKNIILELKAVTYVTKEQRHQLWNYMRLTKQPYGMLLNFGADSLYSEWYEFDTIMGEIKRIKPIDVKL